MDLSQWETSSIINMHRACIGTWKGYLRDFKKEKENEDIVTIEVDSQGHYSKMK